jgi:hypothetical protein
MRVSAAASPSTKEQPQLLLRALLPFRILWVRPRRFVDVPLRHADFLEQFPLILGAAHAR